MMRSSVTFALFSHWCTVYTLHISPPIPPLPAAVTHPPCFPPCCLLERSDQGCTFLEYNLPSQSPGQPRPDPAPSSCPWPSPSTQSTQLMLPDPLVRPGPPWALYPLFLTPLWPCFQPPPLPSSSLARTRRVKSQSLCWAFLGPSTGSETRPNSTESAKLRRAYKCEICESRKPVHARSTCTCLHVPPGGSARGYPYRSRRRRTWRCARVPHARSAVNAAEHRDLHPSIAGLALLRSRSDAGRPRDSVACPCPRCAGCVARASAPGRRRCRAAMR